jgi:sugar phosphate isomerase/epimerase
MKLTAVGLLGFKDHSPEIYFPFLKQLGIDTVQVVRDKHVKLPIGEVKQILSDYELKTDSYHAAFGSHVDLSAEDPNVRAVSLEVLSREAEFACDLGAGVMVIHPSGSGEEIPAARDNFLRSVESLVRILEKLPLRGLIENLPPMYSYGSRIEELIADVKRFDSPSLGICFDSGHANMRDDSSLADQVRATGGFIHFIHAHDNNKRHDQHLLPMSGSIQWEPFFESLSEVRYAGTFCLEVFESIKLLNQKMTSAWMDKIQRWLADGQK